MQKVLIKIIFILSNFSMAILFIGADKFWSRRNLKPSINIWDKKC